MTKDTYNWWTDPKNKEEVYRLSWWNHEENKEVFSFPISVVRTDNVWVASCNDETKKYLGDLSGCGHGETKQEAIEEMFLSIRLTYEFLKDENFNYQRWVPFRHGNWNRIGGTWFVIFGLHFYFRRGKNMKGGWYIPFTKLNISISNEWVVYNRFKKSLEDRL